jgi:DNA-binding NtrC family response regulator
VLGATDAVPETIEASLQLAEAALVSSKNERRSMEVEREISNLYRAYVMRVRDPAGGHIERDAKGKPTGTLQDTAFDIVEKQYRGGAADFNRLTLIEQTLVRTKGNVSMASKLLDIDRKWLMKLMEELGIDADKYRS